MKKSKKCLAAFLSALLMFTMLPTTAFAVPVMGQPSAYGDGANVGTPFSGDIVPYGLTNSSAMPDFAGASLVNNTVYTVYSNITITAVTPGQNGLNVANGATAVIYIPSGVTLTVKGGNGSSGENGSGGSSDTNGSTGRGAGAGIYVPSDAVLIITGGGKLVASGGAAANGNLGSTGVQPYDNGYNIYSGSGEAAGQGGAGGGGAGAGIGGSGGSGAAGMKPPRYQCCTVQWGNVNGSSGSSGVNGSGGEGSGTVYVMGSVTVNAAGGFAGQGGTGGDKGQDYQNSTYPYIGCGGIGGGGGGGGGSAAYGIGGGGGGGGSGGGGGFGGIGKAADPQYPQYRSAGGNGGSGGAPYGSGGKYGHSGVNWGRDGYNATATTGGAVNIYDNTSLKGGNGGNGGNAGTQGASGAIYKSSTATVTGSTGSTPSSSAAPGAIQYAVSLDHDGGTSSTSAITAVLGYAMPQITIPSKTGYALVGYFGAQNGNGNKYYNANGTSVTMWNSSTATRIYAYWANNYTVVYNGNGSTGGSMSSSSFIYGTAKALTPNSFTKAGYTFEGWNTNAMGTGASYADKQGVSNLTTTPNGTVNLYARWTANTYTMTLDRQGGTGGSTSGTLTYGSPIPQSVTPPTKTGYTFDGYYSSANGAGTQYYSNTGARVYQTAWATAGGTTLYAKWIAPYTLTFDDQGGSGGQGSAAGNSGTAIPASVTVPKRLGYTFGGYYTAANGGGEKYYDASGARNGTINFTGSRNIFASWIVKTSTLTLDPAGGAMGGSADTKTETKNYNDMTNIPTPAREGHTFLGWRVENAREITDPATDKHGSYNKTASKFTFGTVDATMTALWLAQSNVDYDVVDGTGSGSLLDGSLGTIVTDGKGGVTEEDVAEGNTVSLKLTVNEKSAADAPSSDLIEGIKQGDKVQYYDVKVEKTVTTQGGGETTTILTTTPKPVRAIIPIPQEIQGRTSYTVYRIHSGAAEKIPADPTAVEYYEVNSGGTTLTLHVRKFSTYAVVLGDKSLSGSGNLGGDNGTNSTGSGMDVQGKILEGTLGTYKLDISWGAMKFDFNAAGTVWDPDTHSYTPGGTQGWTNESFEKGNNKITVANHSNGDVLLGYLAVPNTSLSGVTMTVRSTNSPEGIEAEDILLEKVPTETAAAPTVDTYVWLTGTPTDLVTLTKESYTKAGVITVTAAADMTSGLTPKNP